MQREHYSPNAKFNFDFALKTKAKDDSGFFVVGFASTPGLDRHGEIISEEALKKAASNLLKKPNNVLFLNHNYDRPIGVIQESAYVSGGLMIKAKISNTEPVLREQISEGLWNAFSIGGIVKEAEEIKNKEDDLIGYKITEIELVEVSLVGVPANPEATLLEVISKSLFDKNAKIVNNSIEAVVKSNKVIVVKEKEIVDLKEVYALGGSRKSEDYVTKDIFSNFLNEESHKQKVITQSYNYFKLALISKAIQEYIGTAGWVCKEIININPYNSNDRTRPVFSNLQTSRDIKEELLVDGYFCLEKGNDKLVVGVFPAWSCFYTAIYSDSSSKDLASNFVTGYETWAKENNFFIGEKITAKGEFLDIPDMDFDTVKLPADQKKAIKVGALEFFNKKDIYIKNNLPFKRGLIFAGEPGTGKTLTGKALLNKSESTFIWVTSADLSNSYGDINSKAFKQYLEMAKELSPCILFAEDVDDYLDSKSAVDTIKTQMDGLNSMDGVVTILCTNYPESIPKSLIDRPSRFDDVIKFELPDEELRLEILEAHMKSVTIKDRDTALKTIAKKSEGLTGAHLKEVAVYSILLAADDNNREEINLKDLNKALDKVLKTRELINNMVEKKKYVQDIRKFTLGGEIMNKEIKKKTEKVEEVKEEKVEEVKDVEDVKTEKVEDENIEVKEEKVVEEEKKEDVEDVEEKVEEVVEEKEFNLEETLKAINTKLDSFSTLVADIKAIKEATVTAVKSEKLDEAEEEVEEVKEIKPKRKAVIVEEKGTEEEALLKQLEEMSLKEIMETPAVWDKLDKDMQKEIKNKYVVESLVK